SLDCPLSRHRCSQLFRSSWVYSFRVAMPVAYNTLGLAPRRQPVEGLRRSNWRSAASSRRSAATEGNVTCNVRVGRLRPQVNFLARFCVAVPIGGAVFPPFVQLMSEPFPQRIWI